MGAAFEIALRCSAGLALLGMLYARAEGPSLRAFDALYEARYKGFPGGTMLFSLRAGAAANEYIYTVEANPNFFGRIAVSEDARQSSVMHIAGGQVLPQRYLAEDGKKSTGKDSDLRFDWGTRRLTGTAQSTAVDEALDVGWHDYLSAQVAILLALSRGEEPGTLHVLDGKQIRAFRYIREGTERRKFNEKEVDALLLRSEGVDDSSLRINRYWHAPELGFLPVLVERSRKGKVDVSLRLVELKFLEAPEP
jgi:hypothetical protein